MTETVRGARLLHQVLRHHHASGKYHVEKLVSDRYRFVWVCIPKAASRSIIRVIRTADPQVAVFQHETLRDVYEKLPRAREYFNFAFIRHPVTRLRSTWQDKIRGVVDTPWKRHLFVDPYPGLSPSMSYAEFCRWTTTFWGQDVFADRHWASQWMFARKPDGSPLDFVGSYENLDDDWATVAKMLAMPSVSLPTANASANPDGDSAGDLPPELVARVRRRYRKDYILGGYE